MYLDHLLTGDPLRSTLASLLPVALAMIPLWALLMVTLFLVDRGMIPLSVSPQSMALISFTAVRVMITSFIMVDMVVLSCLVVQEMISCMVVFLTS